MKNILLLLFTLAVTIPAFAQQSYNVSGTVSAGNGQTLPGATISLPDLQKRIVTDAEGRFRINVPEGKTKVIVTFVGYDTTAYILDPLKTLQVSIVMQPRQTGLKEVTVSTG